MTLPRLLGCLAAAWLLAPPAAPAARFAVGLEPGADATTVRSALERGGGVVESLAPLRALVVEARRPPRASAGVRYVERLRVRRIAFTPNDPLFERQWYALQIRAFDAWEEPPPLAPVRVAVIDSGIDAGHPELVGRIVGARSFVGGSARMDTQGHGTFVAGLIAAEVGNGVGIAGLAPGAELLVAKVVAPDRTIPVEAEARAVRWAVRQGARVINMSLGGLRDPLDASLDTYSQLEADAIAFAVTRGVTVVAAVGNGDQAPERPWRFASYPAALPHVLGVSALARDGSAPVYSNRDAIFNDVAAPGQELLSTLPRALTATRASCVEQGYSSCGPDEYRAAEGTSFAAPQAAAAAATLLGLVPSLRAEQVTELIERSAVDANASNGCRQCPLHRDSLTGWGRLDVAAAVAALGGPLPPADRHEANDDAGARAYTLWGQRRRVDATLDFWDDQTDVYRVHLRRRQRLYVSLVGPPGTDPSLVVWKPGTEEVDDLSRLDLRAKISRRAGRNDFLGYRAVRNGWHFVQVKLPTQGSGAYRLQLVKR